MNMYINPVFLKELKVRMRGWRAAGIVAAYLILLALVAVASDYDTGLYGSITDNDTVMRTYTIVAILQFILILFIVPALTAGAISGEREKQTLDLIVCTKLTPLAIIMGKLFASVSQIVLLVVASLPIFSTVFRYGGISFLDILALFLFYIVTAIMIGGIGIFYSAFFKRTTAAAVLTYVTVILMTLGMILGGLFYIEIVHNGRYPYFLPMFYANPVVGFTSLLTSQFGVSAGFDIVPGFHGAEVSKVAVWVIHMIFDICLTAILVLFAARKIDPVGRSLIRISREDKIQVQQDTGTEQEK